MRKGNREENLIARCPRRFNRNTQVSHRSIKLQNRKRDERRYINSSSKATQLGHCVISVLQNEFCRDEIKRVAKASGKFAIRSEVGRAPFRRLSSKGATWSLRIIGLVHSPFKAVMVGSNPPGITIWFEIITA